MAPRVIEVDAAHPDPRVMAEAARVLRDGGLVAFPTETVYGLGARARDPGAVAKVFAAKGRPSGHPLIAHVHDEEAARAIAASWSARASELARAFWPGPLTLVVPRGDAIPREVTGGGDSVAIRAPAHPVALALLRALGEPLAAPSANKYQGLSPTVAAHVVKSLGEAVDLVIDGGACTAGIESTVVDVTVDPPRVLRPGTLHLDALRICAPDIVYAPNLTAAAGTHASPGLDARHYSPRARLVVAADRGAAIARARDEGARATREGGARAGLVVRDAVSGSASSSDHVVTRALSDDPALFARDLFATLHALDDAGCSVIVIEAVPDDDAWWAVADRLRRAAAR